MTLKKRILQNGNQACCKGFVVVATFAFLSVVSSEAGSLSDHEASSIINFGFESGDLDGWEGWRTKRAAITDRAYLGQYAVALGPEIGKCSQEVGVEPNSRYRLSAWVKTETGSEEVMLQASDYGGSTVSASSALTEYSLVSVEFNTAYTANTVLITLKHPLGGGIGYADHVQLQRIGEAPPVKIQKFVEPVVYTQLSEGGVAQQPEETMQWYLDAKFGMFIHWGVYAAIDEGNEWVMHNEAFTYDAYRARAEDTDSGFTASQFNPAAWAELARNAGMKYMVLTARHHDGYALFNSQHPNSWTSVQHLGRDLISEYTDAVREAGLYVGLYYSPMSWRYPGYYNVTGDDCKPNVWGYVAADWHKENARLMKEEVYEQLNTLLSNYGKIDYMFWDGAWLGQSINHELEDRFWDTGRYVDPESEWPVADDYLVRETSTNKPLGVMGMVRKHQPNMIVNERFSWIGDVGVEEGSSATSGGIRNERYMEKCMSLQKGGWGYFPNRPVFSAEEVVTFLSDCATRNINFLLNVAPDRFGVIPDEQKEVLLKTGAWLKDNGGAIYNTRGGPWQPQYGEYGFTYRDNKIYCHVYKGYRNRAEGTFTTHSIGDKHVAEVTDLSTGRAMSWNRNKDNTITIENVDYSHTPHVTILKVTLKEGVYEN